MNDEKKNETTCDTLTDDALAGVSGGGIPQNVVRSLKRVVTDLCAGLGISVKFRD